MMAALLGGGRNKGDDPRPISERSIAGPVVPRQPEEQLIEEDPLSTKYVGAGRAALETAVITREEIELPNASERRRGGFAFVLHNVFSAAECAAMIAASEQRGYDQALVNAGHSQILDTSYRNSMRNIWDDRDTADEIQRRIAPHLPSETEQHCFGYVTEPVALRCDGLNERLRFLRYDPGDFFAEHRDGSYIRPDGSSRSYLTLMLYLNCGGGVDFAGGETSFVSQSGAEPDVAFVPRAGDVLIFTHPVLHQGNEVTRGRKYAVRTDVMYSEVELDDIADLHVSN